DGSSLTLSVPPSSQVGAQEGLVLSSTNVPPLSLHSSPSAIKDSNPHVPLGESMDQSKVPLESVIWPALSVKSVGKKVHHNESARIPRDDIPPATAKYPTDKNRFPWTARLNPKSRNLHRVTMPEYMEDGTPKRGLWHVDDCLMFVAAWNSSESLSLPEISTIPLYSILAIEWIASGLGEPMLSHKPWLDPTMLGEAKILVEVELDKPFPQKVAAWDKQGNFSMVDVEYSWLPAKCEKCGHLGHKAKRCLSMSQQKTSAKAHDRAVLVDANGSLPVGGVSTPVTSADLTIPPAMEVPLSNTLLDSSNESNFAEPNIANENDLSSLAIISVLDNMYKPLSFVSINESMESPSPESPQKLSSSTAPISSSTVPTAQENSTATKDGSGKVEPVFSSNKFASLINVEEEEDSLDSVKEMDSMDFMSPSGKRMLRERPVKPSTKAKEMHLQSTSRGRGNRGRGNRCGRG
ncbi:hypothetical protein N665_0116s0003, partial [Sinapis alba]